MAALDPLKLARSLSGGRLAIGVAMAAAPGPALKGWLGEDADRPAAQVAYRAFGVREAFLGFLGLHVAGRPGVGARTIQAMALCDAADLAITLGARRHLPASGVALIGLVAGSAAIAGTVAARGLPQA